MTALLTSGTIVLMDKNFYYETYRAPGITELGQINDFYPSDGYVSIGSNIGDINIIWDPKDYPLADISKEFSYIKMEVLRMNNQLSVDEIYYSWELRDGRVHVTVKDKVNPEYSAELVVDTDKYHHILVKHSTFANEARKYQMLYYAEVNKSCFLED